MSAVLQMISQPQETKTWLSSVESQTGLNIWGLHPNVEVSHVENEKNF